MKPAAAKSLFLQIRVSADEKRVLQIQAQRAGMDVSAWVLSRTLPSLARTFDRLASRAHRSDQSRYAFAELHDFLAELSAQEFAIACRSSPFSAPNGDFVQNYVAAMVDHAAQRRHVDAPSWTSDIPALGTPHFGTDLTSLRLHLLVNSAPAFRRRNIFVDAAVGERV